MSEKNQKVYGTCLGLLVAYIAIGIALSWAFNTYVAPAAHVPQMSWPAASLLAYAIHFFLGVIRG